MPKHIQQTHLNSESFDISSEEEVSVNTITNADRDVKVTANENNVEFQVTDSVDLELTSAGNLDFKSANQGLSFMNGQTITGETQQALLDRLSTIENTAFNTGRSFVTFNDGFTIDRNNLASFEDKNIIYAARNNKDLSNPNRPDVNLPNDTEIQASGEPYPIVFEFSHLGGTADAPSDSNNLRFFLDGTLLQSIRRDQVAIVTKPAVGQAYEIVTSNFDPNQTLLPQGTFNLKTDTVIDDIVNIATELGSVTIVSGDAFQVQVGGTWSGYTVTDDSVLVALVNNPSLVDSASNEDWLLLDNPRVIAKSAALLANFAQNGTRFDASRNVFVNEANVREFNSTASGVPLINGVIYARSGNEPTQVTRTFTNQALQFSDLVGGTLTLNVSIQVANSSGFLPEFQDITLTYGSTEFIFPIAGIDASSGTMSVSITIPNQDYSSILNTNCDVRLRANFRGANYLGTMTIVGVVNTLDGTLRQAVTDIANEAAASAEARVQQSIDQLRSGIQAEDANFGAIQDRLMQYRIDSVTTPEQGARFQSTSTQPTSVGDMDEVSPSNPRFTASGTTLYVAVVPNNGDGLVLSNITQSTVNALTSPVASLSFEGQTYFLYQVTTGVAANDVLEVQRQSRVQVVAERADIAQLQQEVAALEAEQEDLPDAVRNILENGITVSEESTPNVTSSDFNNNLGTTVAQKIFAESSPNAASSGSLNSNPWATTGSGSRARRKLVYIGKDHEYGNAILLQAFDGASGTTELARYLGGVIEAAQFVPAIPAGSTTVSVYPAPSNSFGAAGFWHTIETLTFQNGIPVQEADELFFTRDVPSQPTTLTVDYRGHANGNVFGTGQATLANVGGNDQVSTTFTISDGSETATVEVTYFPNFQNTGRAIRVSVTERVLTGLPTINDVQVILSYTETRTVPATPATVRYLPIENQAETGHSNVIAIKPSASGTVVLVGDQNEVDTGYAYTTVFGAGEAGHVTVFSENAVFYDYENITPISTTVQLLEQHSDQPNFGLFDTEYTHETRATLGIAITAENSQGDAVQLGQELVLVAPNNTRWRLSVNNSGNLITTQVT